MHQLHLPDRALSLLCALGPAIALGPCSGCQSDETAAAKGGSMVEPDLQGRETASQLSADDARQVAALIDTGHANFQRGRWIAAAQSLSGALKIDPANEQAIAGLNDALARVDQQGRLDETAQIIELRAAAALAEFDAGYQRSLQALDEEDFEVAKGAILHARATLLRNREIIPTGDFQPRDSRAAELLDSIDRVWELHVRHGG